MPSGKSQKRQTPTRRNVGPARSARLGIWLWRAGLLIAVIAFYFVARDAAFEPLAYHDIYNPSNSERGMWFTQDDAYISFRYAHNAMNGHGLVFNPGEHVEGYTNFFWVILTILSGQLGYDFDSSTKVMGVLAAVGMIVLTALMTREVARKFGLPSPELAGVLAALLLSFNGSLGYWTPSGLETAWFGLCVTLSLWLWLRRSLLSIPALAVATMSRPEGGLVWLILVAAEAILERDWKRSLVLLGGVGVLLAPFGAFKLEYYGRLLPNPFYAKTGFSLEYWQSGIEYVWMFFRDYGLYGLGIPLVILAVWPLTGRWRVVPALFLIFTVYIASVGGDVLRPNRFFVPILAPMAVSLVVAGFWLGARLRARALRPLVPSTVLALVGIWGFITPRELILKTRDLEMGLTGKMKYLAEQLAATDSRAFTMAVSTIGMISYGLPNCRVIDMLGLTDSTIARHPESIPGNSSTWKERNYNATYVLSQNPDYILFSTGHKPSAPAERALYLHSKYRRNYYTILYPYVARNLAIHKLRPNPTQADTLWPDIQLAHDVNAAYNYQVRHDLDSAYYMFDKIAREGPGDFCMPLGFCAATRVSQGLYQEALQYVDSALAIDSLCLVAWQTGHLAAERIGDTARAGFFARGFTNICPWLTLEQ
jgi:hypothetical protein